MHWSTDSSQGSIIYWIKYKRFYLGVTFLGHRSVSQWVLVHRELPSNAIPRDSDKTPSVVTRVYKQATEIATKLQHGQMIRVKK